MFKRTGNILLGVFGKRIYVLTRNVYLFLRFKIFYSLVGVFINKNRKFQIEGQHFSFPPYPLNMYGMKFQFYELSERRLIKNHIKKNDTILELGANVGVVSCITNQIIEKKTNHIVVEPNPNIIPYLKANKKTNQSGFIIEQSIISDQFSEIKFNIDKNYLASSVYEHDELNLTEQITVQCSTLDTLSSKHNLKFDTLIMDIEGHEYDFLMENNLTNFKKNDYRIS